MRNDKRPNWSQPNSDIRLNNELQSSGLQLSFPEELPQARTTEQAISQAVHLHDNKKLEPSMPPVEAAIVVMSRFVSVNFNSRKKSGTLWFAGLLSVRPVAERRPPSFDRQVRQS